MAELHQHRGPRHSDPEPRQACRATGVAEFLSKEGFDVEKRQVELDEPIRQLGVYTVTIKLYRDVSARLKVWVVKEEQQ